MPQHIERQGFQDAGNFLTELHHSGYSIIKLSRRNLLLCAISLLYAEKNKKFHYDHSERYQGLSRIDLDPSDVLKRLERFQFLASLQTSITESIPHLELIYEDHLLHSKQHQYTVNLVTDYLGLPHAPVFSNLARIGTENLDEYITNLDEIVGTLRATGAVQYLDEKFQHR
jgi:hypothetical protein